ncbi:RES family NAD+ phosphorylase [Novosphingobium sp. SL115]|uniref:RES family NAD+ phosphorylase n=1 Tax=Novosphingobium sp. SL115 TaxID=2995150 RepID=UPI0022738A10|nr:RES family NAD+ phosphorylase [Novosphingobium sp. SL115]MCY1672688.1 RES family NAD+ phosphorylase [Novosphingobium sp. SL115]
MMKKVGLSRIEMREQIRRLNRIDFSKSDYKTVKAIVSRMIAGVPIMVGPTKSHELFFRVRKNPRHKLRNVSELCAPSADCVSGFQRCNAPGQPMLYCSSRRITALLECDVQTDDVAYISQWIGKKQLPVNKVFDMEEDQAFMERLDEKDTMFYAYLDALFTRKVPKDFSTDYKPTAAISDIFTSYFKEQVKDLILEDGRIGIRYPSVVDLENSYNTAFPPHFALDRLDLLHVMELKIQKRQADEILVSLSDTATDFDDGVIHWTGDTTSIPVPRDPKGGVLFRFTGEKWRVLTTEHLPVPADIAEPFLNELLKE